MGTSGCQQDKKKTGQRRQKEISEQKAQREKGDREDVRTGG